jgi:hydroxymethylbilane synthase
MKLRIATRGSDLALWQAHRVADLLRAAHPGLEVEVRTWTTRGDRELDPELKEIGGQGLFTAEIDRALLTGEAELAVHSLKDLPIESPAGLRLVAIPERAPIEDLLISKRGEPVAELPEGGVVGTSSPRRAGFLLSERPDLKIVNLRGNVPTRLSRVAEGDLCATMLARAGLERLGLGLDSVGEVLGPPRLLPAPGQGAMAVTTRADADDVAKLVAALDDADTRAAVEAERGVLAGLGGGCSMPLGAYAERTAAGWRVSAALFREDGGLRLDETREGADPAELARACAAALLDRGAAELVAAGGDSR